MFYCWTCTYIYIKQLRIFSDNVKHACLCFDQWHMFYQVGIMGLVEEEWIETLATLDPEDVTYLDFVSKGNELCQSLKEKVILLFINI